MGDQNNLEQLQQEGLAEGKELVNKTHVILANFHSAPYDKVEELRALVSALGGNLNAIGLTEFALWIHEAEEVLAQVVDLVIRVDAEQREQLELHLLHWLLDLELTFLQVETGNSQDGFKENSLDDIICWCEKNGGVKKDPKVAAATPPSDTESEEALNSDPSLRQDMIDQILDDAETGWIPGCQSEEGDEGDSAEASNANEERELVIKEQLEGIERDQDQERDQEQVAPPAVESAVSMTGEIAPILEELKSVIVQVHQEPLDSVETIIRQLQSSAKIMENYDGPFFMQLLNSVVETFDNVLLKLSCLPKSMLQVKEIQDDLGVLEFFTSELLSDLNAYLLTIDLEGEDSEELFHSKAGSLKFVTEWDFSQLDRDQVVAPTTASATEPYSPPVEKEPSEVMTSTATDDWNSNSMDEVEEEVGDQEQDKIVEDNQIGKYLICRNGGHQLAIAISYVLEIIPSEKLSNLPYQHSKIKGLYNLRGEPLPIMLLGEVEAMKREEE
ncbi:MAG: chemotaxis protein CheW, partial [Bdellovibrionales bacterium]|nr:chemotaxis protein CheW [Bdellovibrionales bacterium]